MTQFEIEREQERDAALNKRLVAIEDRIAALEPTAPVIKISIGNGTAGEQESVPTTTGGTTVVLTPEPPAE